MLPLPRKQVAKRADYAWQFAHDVCQVLGSDPVDDANSDVPYDPCDHDDADEGDARCNSEYGQFTRNLKPSFSD